MEKKYAVVICVLLIIPVFISGCKSVDASEMNARDAIIIQQGQLIEDLENHIDQLETTLDEAGQRETLTDEEIAALEAEKTFLEQQLGRLGGDYTNLAETLRKENEAADKAVREVQQLLAPEIASGDIEVINYNGIIIIHIKNRVLFNPNAAVIRPENEEVLTKVASIFDYFPDKIIRVEGHTATGIGIPQYPTSWDLGAARAVNVTRFFQEREGIDPGRLVAVSFGEWRPIASNETQEGKAENRRIEIILINKPLYQWHELLK